MASSQVISQADLMQLGRYEYALACAVIYAKTISLEHVELVLPLVVLDSRTFKDIEGDSCWLQGYMLAAGCDALWEKLGLCGPQAGEDHGRQEGTALALGADLLLRMSVRTAQRSD